MVIGLIAGICQYVQVFQTEIAGASYSVAKPANGHSWTEMECTEGLCVTADNKVGIGTDSPNKKLVVAGDIGATGSVAVTGQVSAGSISTSGAVTATGDVCGAGACLSQIASFVGNQPLVNNVHNQAACTAAGGTVVSFGASYPMCRFNAGSCPSGWTQYLQWGRWGGNHCDGCGGGCSTPLGDWASPAVSAGICYWYGSARIVGDCAAAYPCPSVLTQIGCY